MHQFEHANDRRLRGWCARAGSIMMQCTHACESQGQAEIGVTVADHAAHARSRHVGTTRDGRLMAVIQMGVNLSSTRCA